MLMIVGALLSCYGWYFTRNSETPETLKIVLIWKCKSIIIRNKIRLFLDSLKIDVVNLNRISNKKINQLAKYNFHADTVSQQVHYYEFRSNHSIDTLPLWAAMRTRK